MFKSAPDSTETFWINQEKRLQCKITSYALSQYSTSVYKKEDERSLFLPNNKKEKPIWGITFISKKGFHFYHFPQQNWLSSFTKKNDEMSSQEYVLDLDFSSISSWQAPEKPKSFWGKLWKTHNEYLIIICNATAHIFNLDIRKKDIIEDLKTYIKDKQVQSL